MSRDLMTSYVAAVFTREWAPVLFKRSFDLGNGVVLRRVPDWIKRDENLVAKFRERGLRFPQDQFALFVDVKGLIKKRRAPESQLEEINRGGRAFDLLVMRANLALWLAKPSPVTIEVFIRREKQLGFLLQLVSVDPNPRGLVIIPHKFDESARHNPRDLREARRLHMAIASLGEGSVWTAALALWRALGESDWALRYLLLWLGLEALFSAQQETTYRLSHRMAFFLARDSATAQEVYQWAQEAYRLRSELIHGRGLSKNARKIDKVKIVYETERRLTDALKRILRNRELNAKFADNAAREAMLDRQLFTPHR